MTAEGSTEQEARQQLSKALHDLCQPLTTLQCRLEMAGVMGTADGYREAVELGLAECSRLIEAVNAMRGMVRAAVGQSGLDGCLREG
jgi:signal transduction histidine kinase